MALRHNHADLFAVSPPGAPSRERTSLDPQFGEPLLWSGVVGSLVLRSPLTACAMRTRRVLWTATTIAFALLCTQPAAASVHQLGSAAAAVSASESVEPGTEFFAFLKRARAADLVVEVIVEATRTVDLHDSAGSETPQGGAVDLDESARAPFPATLATARVTWSLDHQAAGPGELLEVLVPGGRWSDGERDLVAWVEAAPTLRQGDHLVLLLEPWRGAWTPIDLRAGVARIDPQELAFLEPSRGLERTGTAAVAAVALESLRSDLTTLHRGSAALDTSKSPSEDLQTASAAFELTLSPDGLPPFGCGDGGGNPLRWFEFERARTLDVFAQASGQPGVPGGGFAAVARALAAWTDDPGSRVLLRYAGTTPATQAVSGLDGLTSISFEDPGDVVPGSFPNRSLLALTIAFFDCTRLLRYGGGLAHALVEFGIVTQDGVGSFFLGNQPDPDVVLAELLAHEVGHGLGFAHPCDGTATDPCIGAEDDALMRAVLHQDGRDATLGSDDRAALAFHYPEPSGSPPPAPTALTAEPTAPDAVELTWQAAGSNLIGFDIEARRVGGTFTPIASAAGTARNLAVTGLGAAVPRLFRVRARSATGLSTPSGEVAATPLLTAGSCVETPETLCLNQGRFLARSFYATPDGRGGGNGVQLTTDTGTYWFFEPSNVELIVKVIDACVLFDRYWVFAGALTDVETALLVADTATGATRTYFNPPQTPFLPVQDTSAFSQCP